MLVINDSARPINFIMNAMQGKSIQIIPGKNDIKDEDWNNVVKEYGERLETYSFVRALEPKLDPEVKKEHPEKEIPDNVSEYDFASLKDLVDNTFEVSELEEALKLESKKQKPRKKVTDYINKKIKELKALDERATSKAS